MLENERNLLSGRILDAAIEVHKQLGQGLLESVYEICLCKELMNREIDFNVRFICRLPIKMNN